MAPDLLARIAALEQAVERLEGAQRRPFVELRGTGGRRARVGLQDDGTWGIRIWNSAGALLLENVGP